MTLEEQQRILDDLWNFDMTQVPKGHVVAETVEIKGKMVERKRFNRVEVFLLLADGHKCLSYWIPEQDRWNLLTKDQEPIAFIPIPNAPKNILEMAA